MVMMAIMENNGSDSNNGNAIKAKAMMAKNGNEGNNDLVNFKLVAMIALVTMLMKMTGMVPWQPSNL